MAEKKVTLQMLKAVAEDFNSFMFEEGKGIDLKLKQAALQKEIVESAGELADDDIISAETAETLALLNLKHEAQVADAEEIEEEVEPETDDVEGAEEEEDNVPEEDPDPGEEEELDDEVEPEDPKVVKALLADVKKAKDIEAVKAIAKARGIRIPPPFLKDLAKLKTYVTGKLDGSAPVTPKVEKKSPEKKPSIVNALRLVICKDETISYEKLVAEMVAQGFDPTPATVKTMLNDTKKIIEQLGAYGRLK